MNCKLWLFVQLMLKQLLVIDVSSWISTSFVVIAKTMVQISSVCTTPFISYVRFSKRLLFLFFLYLLYKSIFL